MNDTVITIVGNVADPPRRNRLGEGGGYVTRFRMASTRRRFDSRQQDYVDGETFWVDVECFNDLSANVAASVTKGDPVIVHGILYTNSWESENGRRSNPRVKAFAVGPNLARGTADFRRTGRPVRAAGEEPGEGTVDMPGDVELDPAQRAEATDAADLVPGRDYEPAPVTLDGVDADDLDREPAHA